MSADTLVPSPSDPQQLNRYAYGLNSPLNYTDPSGHAAICGTTAEGCERSWFQPNTQPHPPEAANNAWNLATGLVVAVASIPFEVVDYVATGVQCVTSGCTAAEVAITLIPGAIGPVAKQIDNVLDLAKAAENAGDAVKTIEKADIIADLSAGTTQSQRIAGAMQEGKIGVNILGDEMFGKAYKHYTGEELPSNVAAFARGRQTYLRQGSSSIFSDAVHEGTHALDYIDKFKAPVRSWEKRAYYYERQFQLRKGRGVDISKLTDMLKHIEDNY